MLLPALLAALAYVSPAEAFFRVSCQNILTIERADPILSPGAVSGHVHAISGGSSFSPFTTGAALRNSTCSSCIVTQDKSAYWSPNLYFEWANGSFSSVNPPQGADIYYKLFTNPADPTNITAFPDDFRFISGNSTNRAQVNFMQGRIDYNCLQANGSSSSTQGLPVDIDCPGGLGTGIVGPSCWDGINVDSPNHQSHIAWPTWDSGPCPPGYPQRVPALRYEISYSTGDFSAYRDQAKNPQQPFVFSSGDATGYGYHFDFFSGWNRTVQQQAIEECTDETADLTLCTPFVLYPGDHSCIRTPDINEVVTGTIPTLPGCNPPTWGPAAATPCTAPSVPPFIPNPVVYTSSAPPVTAVVLDNSPRVLMATGNWTYEGCYNNTQVAFFDGVGSANHSVEACVAACDAAGYDMCGVGYGGWWCNGGITLSNTSTAIDAGNCGRPCVDSPLNFCGSWDDNIMELYTRPPRVTIPQSVGNWSFLSCYTDWVSGTPTLSKNLWDVTARTIPACLADCDANGFTYCGMDGNSCSGGIEVNAPNTPVNSGLCNVLCLDDPTGATFCGGNGKNAIYTRPPSTTIVQKAGNYSYQTCFQSANSSGVQTMTTQLSPLLETVESCAAACELKQFAYCGLQYYGNLCYGSNTLAVGAVAADPGTCATYCNGAKSEWCGGYSSISLYQRNVIVVAVAAAAVKVTPTSSSTSSNAKSSSALPSTSTASKSTTTSSSTSSAKSSNTTSSTSTKISSGASSSSTVPGSVTWSSATSTSLKSTSSGSASSTH